MKVFIISGFLLSCLSGCSSNPINNVGDLIAIAEAGNETLDTRTDSVVPPADYETFEKAASKGKTLMEQMTSNDHDAGKLFEVPQESAESKFLDTSKLLPLSGGLKITSLTRLNRAIGRMGICSPPFWLRRF